VRSRASPRNDWKTPVLAGARAAAGTRVPRIVRDAGRRRCSLCAVADFDPGAVVW